MIRSSRNGFTLLELIVVITIIAILTASMVPEFKGTHEEARLRTSGRQLVMLLRLAYSQSVTAGQPCRVRVALEKGRFWLETTRADDAGHGEFVPASHLPRWECRLPPEITADIAPTGQHAYQRLRRDGPDREGAGRDAIRFEPDGTADAIRIRLLDRKGFELALTVDPTTSRIHLSKMERRSRRAS